MASLVKTCRCGRGGWAGCRHAWYVRARVGGRDAYTNVGPDRGGAERALRRHETAKGETVGETVDAWLAAKARDPNARPNSLATYRSRASHVRAYFGRMPTRSLRPDDLGRFADDLLASGASPATVQGVYATLTASLRHAQRRGVVRDVPLPPGGPGIPTPAPRRHELTLEQVEGVIAAMPGTWGKVAELVYLTGLRWGEAVALERGDVQGAVARIRRTRNKDGGTNEPKTAAGLRAVPLSGRARAILDELKLPVEGDYRQARLALVAAMGGLHQPGMGWHTIRAAHSQLLEETGHSLRETADRLGHGAAYATTFAYRVRGEPASADVLDSFRGGSGGEGPPAEVARLDEARARRRRPRGG